MMAEYHRQILFHVGRNNTAYYTIHEHQGDNYELIRYDARFPPEWARDKTVVHCRLCQRNQNEQGLWIGYCVGCACEKYLYTRGYGFSNGVERTWKEAYTYARRNNITQIQANDGRKLLPASKLYLSCK